MPRLIDDSVGAVGAIISSMLTESQFQAINGPGWVLADGRTLASNDKYRAITGQTAIPDLRGMVLRGKNNGGSARGTRADGAQNPDGDTALGTYQADNFGSHNHGGASGTPNVSLNHNHNLWGQDNSGSNGFQHENGNNTYATTQGVNAPSGSDAHLTHTHTIAAQGGNETRMKNVTVNHFIRIN